MSSFPFFHQAHKNKNITKAQVNVVHSNRTKRSYLNPLPDPRIRPPWCGFVTGNGEESLPDMFRMRGVMTTGVDLASGETSDLVESPLNLVLSSHSWRLVSHRWEYRYPVSSPWISRQHWWWSSMWTVDRDSQVWNRKKIDRFVRGTIIVINTVVWYLSPQLSCTIRRSSTRCLHITDPVCSPPVEFLLCGKTKFNGWLVWSPVFSCCFLFRDKTRVEDNTYMSFGVMRD
jgi:hypothetical protein